MNQPLPHVALLRGVNVSGKHRVPMAELRAAVEAEGFGAVRTYIQSGNVVFTPRTLRTEDLARVFHELIHRAFGHDVPVLVLDAKELAEVVAGQPFLPGDGVDARFCHVTLLASPVDPAPFEALRLPLQPGEAVVARGRALYLHCPGGYGQTKLTNAWFEKALGQPATTRNWATLTTLLQLCGEATPGG